MSPTHAYVCIEHGVAYAATPDRGDEATATFVALAILRGGHVERMTMQDAVGARWPRPAPDLAARALAAGMVA